jgi:hypothetical protein
VPAASAIDDALDRLTPALTDDRAAKPLQMALESLIEAIARQDVTPATAALQRAEAALNAYALAVGPTSGDGADLDAIALALMRVRDHVAAMSRITN